MKTVPVILGIIAFLSFVVFLASAIQYGTAKSISGGDTIYEDTNKKFASRNMKISGGVFLASIGALVVAAKISSR